MVRDHPEIERVDERDENREEVDEPADLGQNRRTRLHDAGEYEARAAVSVKLRPMTERLDVVRTTPRFSGRVFNVRSDDVRYEDGTVHTLDVVEHRGSFAIIATAPDDRLVLVRQYRHPARRCLWEIPAGTAEPVGTAITLYTD